MTKQKIKIDKFQTLDWCKEHLVDWSHGGSIFTLDGQFWRASSYFAYDFDAAISSRNGEYTFIYKRLDTKGLLLKDSEVLREINRSYYHANAYEYPAAFATLSNGRTYLIHCPFEYCRLDLEDVETGEIITNIPGRKPADVFHSRLEVSPCNRYLLSKGWVWHPWDVVLFFDLNACLEKPHLLDENNFMPTFNTEICTASFCSDHRIVFGSSEEPSMDSDATDLLPSGHIARWDISSKTLSRPVKVQGEFGNLIAINEIYAWDLYKFPKLINLVNGKIEDQCEEINSGLQRSSIVNSFEGVPHFAANRDLMKLAIYISGEMVILSL